MQEHPGHGSDCAWSGRLRDSCRCQLLKFLVFKRLDPFKLKVDLFLLEIPCGLPCCFSYITVFIKIHLFGPFLKLFTAFEIHLFGLPGLRLRRLGLASSPVLA